MAEFPYLPLEVQAFMANTQHLDARETGAYAALLFHAWMSADNGLPDDDKRLAMLARCTTAEWRKIRTTVLHGFWFLGQDGFWHQKKLDETRQDVARKSAKATAAAQAKWLKWRETRSADAGAYAGRKQPSGQPPSSSNHNQNQNTSSSENHTDPARDAAPERSRSAPRANPHNMSVNQRMAAIAAKSRKAFMGNA